MNNLRLLTGLLSVVLLGSVSRVYGQTVMTLEDIFRIAESNSAQLRPSLSAQKEARDEINVARSAWLPDINAALSLSYIGNGFTTKRDFSDVQKAPIPHFGNGLSISISQPIYTGGTIKNSIALAELKSTATQYSFDIKNDNIRFLLTGYYLDIYKNIGLRRVVEENIGAAKQVLSEMQARHEHGTALHNDITRYELLISNLELQLLRINNILDILNTNLVTVAGLPTHTVIVPDSLILERSMPKEGVEWWQQEAISHSPSMNLAQVSVDASRRSEMLVRSDRLPKIGLQASWSFDGPILVEVPPINRNLSYWYVGIGVSYNISSLFKNNRALARSRSATHVAMDELEATRENLSMAVKADYVHYLEAYEELKTQQKSVELADRNYHIISTRYSEGMALITDMLDAANAKLEAEQHLVNARINVIYSYYKLLFTSGTI